MPVTAITADNELLSATAIVAADEARDLNYVTTPFCTEQARIKGEGSPSRGSGFKWIQGMGTGEHSVPTRRRTGYEQLDLSFTGVLSPIVLTPAEVVFPIGISATEEDLNGGEDQVIEIAAKRTKQVMGAARRKFEQNTFADGVAQFEDFLTLNGTDNVTDGFIEEDAVGAQGSVVGGFSKATWAALPGAQNQSYDGSGSFNVNGLPGLFQLRTKITARTEDMAGLAVFGSESGMENYKRTIQANERYVNADKLDATGMNLLVVGVPAQIQTFMPNAGTNTTANPWTFLILDMNQIYFVWSNVKRDGYFGFQEFESIGADYDVRVAKILVRGQLWVESWAGSGLLYNADTF